MESFHQLLVLEIKLLILLLQVKDVLVGLVQDGGLGKRGAIEGGDQFCHCVKGNPDVVPSLLLRGNVILPLFILSQEVAVGDLLLVLPLLA